MPASVPGRDVRNASGRFAVRCNAGAMGAGTVRRSPSRNGLLGRNALPVQSLPETANLAHAFGW